MHLVHIAAQHNFRLLFVIIKQYMYLANKDVFADSQCKGKSRHYMYTIKMVKVSKS